MKRSGLVIILAVTALFLATACGGEDATATPTATATSLPTSTATSTPSQEATDDEMSDDTGMMAPFGDLVIALHDMNDSGQSGVAVLTANGDQTEVSIIATAGISELNHIHSGDCMNLGGVEYPLTNIADGSSVTTVDASLETLQAGGLAINLHMAGDPATYTACGALPTQDNAVTVHLHELNDSGQVATASLITQGMQTEVVISATAGISELNHIHSGDCMNLGGVEYPLTNMADGMSVTVVDATLETLQAGGLAINLHMAGDPATYTACADISQAEMGDEMSGRDTGGESTTPPPMDTDIAGSQLPDISIPVGTMVTWTNQDSVSHTTTSGQNGSFDTMGWDSTALSRGQSFSHTFDQVGTFTYTCRIHSSMNGTVTVTASGEASATTSSPDQGEGDY